MKKNINLAIPAIILLLAMGCSETGPDSTVNNTDLTIQSVTYGKVITDSTEFMVGTARQYVFDTLGDPDVIFYGNDTWPASTRDADAYHMYNAIGLSFRIFGDEVKEITLLNGNWIGSNGLMVGLSIEQALIILGDNFDFQDFDGKDFYTFSDFDIMIEVSDATGEIQEINIREGNRTIL